MAVVAIASVLLATVVVGTKHIVNARSRHSAATWFRLAFGADVIYGQEEPPGFYTWLRENTGGDYFATVETIRLVTDDVGDWVANPDSGFVQPLKRLPGLKRLEVEETRISDDGVRQLQELLPRLVIVH